VRLKPMRRREGAWISTVSGGSTCLRSVSGAYPYNMHYSPVTPCPSSLVAPRAGRLPTAFMRPFMSAPVSSGLRASVLGVLIRYADRRLRVGVVGTVGDAGAVGRFSDLDGASISIGLGRFGVLSADELSILLIGTGVLSLARAD
jgi:hypothetical protein